MLTFKEYVEYKEGFLHNVARKIGSKLSRWGRQDLRNVAPHRQYPPHVVAAWNAVHDLEEPRSELQGAANRSDDPVDTQSINVANQKLLDARRDILKMTARNTMKMRGNVPFR